MALSVSAGNAEEVAAGFQRFRDPLPEHATEITGIIGDLYTISRSLKSLEELSRHPVSGDIFKVARHDVDLVSASLQYTLDDVVDFFGYLESHASSKRSAYRKTWAAMSKFFVGESEETLTIRLSKYRTFLGELENLIRDVGPNHLLMSRLRERFKELLVHQDSRLTRRMGALSVTTSSTSSTNSTAPSSPRSDRKPRTRRSYERARPSHLASPTPTSPSSGSFFDIPPLVPPAPGSPVTSSATSYSLGSNALADHWAAQVFFQPRTETRLPNKGDRTVCYGDAQQNLHEWLEDEGFGQLLELSFGNVRVFFYLREDDNRARIVCSQAKQFYCLPLNMLEIIRPGPNPSCLQICRRRRNGLELYVWANLKFATIEVMILFYCTFLALRSQDSGKPVSQIRDYELHQEEELFGSPIMDDGFQHALRVYRDKVTGAIRLQASVHKGEMKRAPIWTAFITDQIRTRGWVRHDGDKIVWLRELRETVFMFPDYNPPKTKRGEHQLEFMSIADAEAFITVMLEIAHDVI
ncbi:hypothetical protein BJY04DRAFT_186190 [Aspergillus karnatakaensis]|uniref:uncharacterized protein n=1 Tax=Aspergillus karnatakaensis TaxID=1810916 RepID=UPI003CCD291D